MKLTLFIFLGLIMINKVFAQEPENNTPNILRVNFLAPGIGYEHSLTERAKLTANIGVTVGGAFTDLTIEQPEYAFLIVPFVDLSYRNIYNIARQNERGRSTLNNSGNYFGAQLIARGNNFNDEIIRTSNSDFSIGPIWGLPRYIRRFNIDLNAGPVYYFDLQENGGLSLMVSLNIGYNLLTH